MSYLRICLFAFASLALTACGGGQKAETSPEPAAAPAADDDMGGDMGGDMGDAPEEEAPSDWDDEAGAVDDM